MKTNAERRIFLKKIIFYGGLIYVSILAYNNIYKEPPKDQVIEEEFISMGGDGKIHYYTKSELENPTILHEAINKIHEIDRLASKFIPYSDISMLNLDPETYNEISEEMLELLEESQKYNELTDGYFDIGMGNFLSISGIDPGIPLVGKNFFSNTYFNKKLIKIKQNKVKIIRKNSMLDLGGIAKGYALDKAMKILIKNGIKHAAIELGGDIKVYGGMPNNTPWNIVVNNGVENDIIKINNGSIAISGGYIKKSSNNINNITHHIIDPKTLTSKNYYTSILVIGKDSITCDVLSTAAYNMPLEDIYKLKNKFKDYHFKIYN